MCEQLDRFEADYQAAKNEIKENLSFLENEYDMMAILAWISRLEEPAMHPEEKAIRNEYTKYLAHQLSRQTLHYPFTEDPPQGSLPPLCVSMVSPICANDCGFVKSEDAEVKAIPCGPIKKTLLIDMYGTALSESFDSTNRSGYSEWPVDYPSPVSSRKDPCSEHHRPKFAPRPGAPCMPCQPCAEEEKQDPNPRVHSPCLQNQKCPPRATPCPVGPPPPKIPYGYLSKTTEEDERLFSPPPPCSEENRTRLEYIVQGLDENTGLYEFLSEVAPLTCDLGETMQMVTSEELANFKDFVKSVYQSRMADTQELMTKEHLKLKARYDEWEANVLRQAQSALRALKLTLPVFKYESYKRDPEYLYLMLRNQMSLEETEGSPKARILRLKAQKKTWLNEEAQRLEKDNMDRMKEMRELNAQLSDLSKTYNASHKKLTETNKCLEDQAAQLRIRHDENQKLIDHFIDQMNTAPRNY